VLAWVQSPLDWSTAAGGLVQGSHLRDEQRYTSWILWGAHLAHPWAPAPWTAAGAAPRPRQSCP